MPKSIFLLAFLVCTLHFNIFSQKSITDYPAVVDYLEAQTEKWGLEIEDINDLAIKDDYVSEHSGARHLYIIQRYRGVEVYNALITVALKPNGEVLSAFSRFLPQLEDRIVGGRAVIEPHQAVLSSFHKVGVEAAVSDLSELPSRDNGWAFRADQFSRTEIPVKLVYQPLEDGTVELAYDLSFDPHRDVDYWSIRVSALTGEVIDQVSWTVSCNMDLIPHHQHDHSCIGHTSGEQNLLEKRFSESLEENRFFGASRTGSVEEESQYRVIPFPYESPAHGDFELVESPYDEEYSPMGWHSISQDGSTDFTYTRGNNTHSFLDRAGNSSPDITVDGGSELVFDFPFDQDLEPQEYAEAAVTNLFYWNNILHDYSYAYGFDEASGNFQAVNPTGQGAGGDAVNAIAQFGAEGGQNLNNATFATPADGSSGTMRMFVWTRNSATGSLLKVDEPLEIAGQYETGTADFGDPVTEDPIIGDAYLVNDGVGISTDACEPIQNTGEISGKIAIIDRGICEFGFKVLNAEQAGAIAVIICNNRQGGIVNMAPGAVGSQATIPSIFISQEDCNIIRQYAGEGLKVRLQREVVEGPALYDASFDNGIIAHEFAHGVSNRLTGGPSASGCLGNSTSGERADGQQMGEGWSDFFSLITGVRPGDTKNTNRGVGNYVTRSSLDARGIRAYPYNYNMSVNPVTYYDTYDASVPHGVGHVWSSMLWDLFWELVDEYGFDEDWYRGSGGNNIAVQLVMDGMKLQPCNPGFVDGRDAILAADQLLYDGANQCLIWSVFARRGLGYGAEQGSPFRVRDAKESYDTPPSCTPTVKLSKEVTPNINAGEPIEVTLTVTNHKGSMTDLVLLDDIPQGTSVDMSSLPAGAVVEGDQVSISIDELTINQTLSFNYTLHTDETLFSKIQLEEDNEENALDRWIQGATVGNNTFILSELNSFSGEKAWFVPNTANTNDQTLTYLTPIEVQGTFPVLRLTHNYNTEPGTDGGLVRVSTDGLESYTDMGYAMFRNEYPNRISGNTFSQGNLDAFSGNSNGWKQTYIDLSDFLDETMFLDFRFGSDDNLPGVGWFIDDLEIFDAFNYHTEAIVTSGEGVEASAYAPGRGTIVEPQVAVNVEEPTLSQVEFTVFPNPVRDEIKILLNELYLDRADLLISDMRGQIIINQKISTNATSHLEKINVSHLPSGIYNITLLSEGETITRRFVKF